MALDRYTVTLTHEYAPYARRLLVAGVLLLGLSIGMRLLLHPWLRDPGPEPTRPPVCTDVDVISPECDAQLAPDLRGLPPVTAAAAHATRKKFAILYDDPRGFDVVDMLRHKQTDADRYRSGVEVLRDTLKSDIDPDLVHVLPRPMSEQPLTPTEDVPVGTWLMRRSIGIEAEKTDAVDTYYREKLDEQRTARLEVLNPLWTRAQLDWEDETDRWRSHVEMHGLLAPVGTMLPFGALGGLLVVGFAGVLLYRLRQDLVLTPHRIEFGTSTVLLHDMKNAQVKHGALHLELHDGKYQGNWSTEPYLLARTDRQTTLEHVRGAIRGASTSEDASGALDAVQALQEQSH